jgi:hypothetical protein
MKARQLLQALVPFFRQFHLHPALIAAAGVPPDQPGHLAPRNQRHDPVMLCLQAFGEFSYGRPFPVRKTLDLEHQQVLQRRYSASARYLLAEAETGAVGSGTEPAFQNRLLSYCGRAVRWPFFHGDNVSQRDILIQIQIKPVHLPDAIVESAERAATPQQGLIASETVGVTTENPVHMKLNILSDLHLSLGALEIPQNDADVVILDTDIPTAASTIS